jgi:ABC-type Fe3+ transport system substrate-binding protein
MQRISQLLSVGYLLLAALITLITVLNGPLGAAPFPIGPSRAPVVVTLDYSSEKQAWLEAAVARFAATNQRVRGRPIQIQLTSVGSGEIVSQIIESKRQPTAISPASSIQTDLLRDEWQARRGTNILADAPQSLALTPLVLVSWQDRGQALWPQGASANLWSQLHDAVADPQGWATLRQPSWGYVKLGHASPIASNSGMQTLLLLAYAYRNKSSGLTVEDVRDPAFQDWLRGIEGAVAQFEDSTGKLIQDMVLYGPSKYDVTAVYENLALSNIESVKNRNYPNLRIYYPPATLLSDHPYAILNAPWVDDDQRAAAALFRDFLLSQPTQELARQYGLRPINAQVSLEANDPNNPFTRYVDNGVQLDIRQQAELPSAEVRTALIEVWRSVASQ